MKKPTAADAEKHAEKGKQLLSAVERIIASDTSIKAVVAEAEVRARSKDEALRGPELRAAVARLLVKRYSDRAALLGGAVAMPAIVPGVGTIAAVGGLLTELAVLLKLEIEMALALNHLFGFDIGEPKERQLAFVMASVGTYDATGGNFFVDLARTEGVAIWNYGPRRLSWLLITATTAVALTWLWRGFFKFVPVLGVVIGTGMNKVLTMRVGSRIARELTTRAGLKTSEAPVAAASKATKATPKKKKKTVKKKPARAARPSTEGDVAH